MKYLQKVLIEQNHLNSGIFKDSFIELLTITDSCISFKHESENAKDSPVTWDCYNSSPAFSEAFLDLANHEEKISNERMHVNPKPFINIIFKYSDKSISSYTRYLETADEDIYFFAFDIYKLLRLNKYDMLPRFLCPFKHNINSYLYHINQSMKLLNMYSNNFSGQQDFLDNNYLYDEEAEEHLSLSGIKFENITEVLKHIKEYSLTKNLMIMSLILSYIPEYMAYDRYPTDTQIIEEILTKYQETDIATDKELRKYYIMNFFAKAFRKTEVKTIIFNVTDGMIVPFYKTVRFDEDKEMYGAYIDGYNATNDLTLLLADEKKRYVAHDEKMIDNKLYISITSNFVN
ncbi:MAG: hypothetical protein RSD69_03995 [Bacilli bacterium]